MNTNRRTALVSGSNRGIGFEICRQLGALGHKIVVTGRKADDTQAAAQQLQEEGYDTTYCQLDVSDPTSVAACAAWLQKQEIRIDILVNNAGVLSSPAILHTDEKDMLYTLQVNALGAWRLCKAFVPGMVERGYGRVVSISSGYGQISDQQPGRGPTGGAYGISKTTLNSISREVAASVLPYPDIKVNVMCPGWVATRMGGAGAPVKPQEAARYAVQLATLPTEGPTDTFFRYGKPIPW